jgi:hypothetical protein
MIRRLNASRPVIVTVAVWAGLSGTWHNALAQAQTQATDSSVPFVGCKSGGQVGSLDAPKGNAKKLAIRAEAGNRLAYYQAENGFGVLAPRGWYCYSIYGSSGSSLSVAPEPINGKAVSGPGIQITIRFGDTSGRVTVAQIIARVFPDYNWFVQRVIAEKLSPASLFPAGPYPEDRLTYRSNKIVEFETPPNAEGLGTDSISMLRANSNAIRGVAFLFSEETNLAQASIRLSPGDRDLVQPIVRQIEKEAADADTK